MVKYIKQKNYQIKTTNRCKGTCNNGRRCLRMVKYRPYCFQHKFKLIVGTCCFCGDACNPCSQACGRCMRKPIQFI